MLFFCIAVCAKILYSTDVFNIDNNKKYQISILEWFLKDHVTLKISNGSWKYSFAIKGINYIRKQ